MRKKIRLIFLSIGLSIALIASIIEIGRIINAIDTQETTQSLTEIDAKALPKGSSFTGGSMSGANTSAMYLFVPGSYCARHEWEIARHARHDGSSDVISDRVAGGRAQEITYKYEKTTEMAQSLAYAQLFGTSGVTMQQLVWASEQWKAYTGGDSGLVGYVGNTETTSSVGIKGRSYQFANFIYKALDTNGQLNLTFQPQADEDKDLRILVNQTDLTYTIGPYVLNFANQDATCVPGTGSEKMSELVYKEIIGKNKGWTEENKFCSGIAEVYITFEDGTKKLTDVGVEVLDETGVPIEGNFPKFGEKFYLKYKTTLDEEIKIIRPSIQINHWKKLMNSTSTYKVYTYKSKHIKYSMLQDNGGLLRQAMNTQNYCSIYVTMDGKNNDHWECYTSIAFGLDTSPRDVAGITGMVVNAIWVRLKEALAEIGADWGLNNINVTPNYKPCLWWHGAYYECPPNAVPYIDAYEVDPGDPTKDIPPEWIAYVQDPLDSSMGGMIGSGESEFEAVEDLNDQIRAGLKVAFKLYGLTIDEDIAESQPNLFLELVSKPPLINKPSPSDKERIELEEITQVEYKVKHRTDYIIERATLPGKEINMYLGGNVWQDMPSVKIGDYTGVREDNSLSMAGIQVELYDTTMNQLKETTTTDVEGRYGFQKLHPMHKYKIIFTYDGMRFEATEYNNDLSGGYSTAEELDREELNDRFDRISSSPQNYSNDGEWRKAYRSVQ